MTEALNRILAYAETVASQAGDLLLDVQIHAKRVALGLSDDLSPLEDLEPERLLAVLLSIADERPSPWPQARELVSKAVVALAQREHESVVALALWAGLDPDESGLSALPPIYRGRAAQRLAQTAAFADPGDLFGWIDKHVPAGSGRDAAIIAAIEARCSITAAASGGRVGANVAAARRWITVAASIGSPLLRARALLRVAPATRGEAATAGPFRACDQMAFTLAQAAYERLKANSGQQRWRGAASALFGAVACRVDPGLAARLLTEAWEQLAGVEALVPRSEALRLLVLAEAQRGPEAWTGAVNAVGDDLRLKAAPSYWVSLARDLPQTAVCVARPGAGSTESLDPAAFKPLWAVLNRIRFPQHRAVGFARYADVFTNRLGGDPGPAMQQVSAALRSTQDPRWREAVWTHVAEACGRAALEPARELTKLGRTPEEKVSWLLVLASLAAKQGK